MLAETYGVGPFQTGGGGGGGGGAGSAAITHVFEGASYIVPGPHSAALLTAGAMTATPASAARALGMTAAIRLIFPMATGLLPSPPTRVRFQLY